MYPPDLTLTGGKKITIYGFAEDDGPVEGEVNYIRKFSLEDGEFFRGNVELTPGMNIIKLGKDTIRVFMVVGSDIPSLKMKSGDEEMTFYTHTLHPALEEGCESCHEYDGGNIALNDDVQALCFQCHDDPTKDDDGKARTFVHSPVLEEECTGCHDPHFSRNKKLLTQEHICLECHDDKDPGETGKGSVHAPVGKMKCASCHDPHASAHKFQLKREGAALCFGCHGDVTRDEKGVPLKFAHEPVAEGDCLSCHTPHVSDYENLLVAQKICLECHDDMDPEQEGYATVHEPVKKVMCASCHSPHASPNPYQLKEPASRLCRGCHQKPHRLHILSAAEGSSTRVPEKFPREKNGDFSCLGCHAPHFSKNRRLFREEESKLCITCHKM